MMQADENSREPSAERYIQADYLPSSFLPYPQPTVFTQTPSSSCWSLHPSYLFLPFFTKNSHPPASQSHRPTFLSRPVIIHQKRIPLFPFRMFPPKHQSEGVRLLIWRGTSGDARCGGESCRQPSLQAFNIFEGMGISMSHSSALRHLEHAKRTKEDRSRGQIKQELTNTHQPPITHAVQQPMLSQTDPPYPHKMLQTLSQATENISTHEESFEPPKKKGCETQKNQQSPSSHNSQPSNSQEMAEITESSSILGGICLDSNQCIRSAQSLSSTRGFRSLPINECIIQSHEDTHSAHPIKSIEVNQRANLSREGSANLTNRSKQNVMLISFAKNAGMCFETYDWSVPHDEHERHQRKIISHLTLTLPNKFTDPLPTTHPSPKIHKIHKIR